MNANPHLLWWWLKPKSASSFTVLAPPFPNPTLGPIRLILPHISRTQFLQIGNHLICKLELFLVQYMYMWAPSPGFLLSSFQQYIKSRITVYCDKELIFARHYAMYRSSAGLTCTLLHRLQSLDAFCLPCSDFTVPCLSVHIVQASYSQPDGGFFFIETFTAWDVLLQILKSPPAYAYTIVEIMWRKLDCFTK
jgi:hypothetical protein